jgi:CheY-like chemotaxis protein
MAFDTPAFFGASCPGAERPEEESGPSARHRGGGSTHMGKHVVLVEDEVNIAEAIRFLLTNDGWRVETIANGASAVEVIRKAAPDLVMLDVMLPGKSGFEILHDLRGDPACSALPILMLPPVARAGTARWPRKPASASS